MSVSVIVPVYNTARYIDECLTSVLSQGVDDIEIICINDGSKDTSAELLHSWSERDNRIKILNQQNAGQGAARNRGVAIARKEFILFVDSDDVLLPGALAYLLSRVHDYHVLSFGHVVFEEHAPRKSHLTSGPISHDRVLMGRQMGVVWNKLIRREWWMLSGIRFREGVIFEDIPVHWRLVAQSPRIGHLASALYGLRVRADSTTSANALTGRRIDSVIAHEEVSEFLGSNESWAELASAHRSIALSNLASCIDALRDVDDADRSRLDLLAKNVFRRYNITITSNLHGLTLRETMILRSAHGHIASRAGYFLFRMARSLFRIARRIAS